MAGQVGGGSDATPRPHLILSRLEVLGEELAKRGLRTTVVSLSGRVPSLHVVNPTAARLAEDVYVGRSQDGLWWFWWPWAERIAPGDEAGEAAAVIARVLDVSDGRD
ncbi:MAG TPA: hypothetical protein VFQ44_19015 [Streptosporangiaceae bacterium]|nr:hypothetical protein [Streptosporangiaceae bacterium]